MRPAAICSRSRSRSCSPSRWGRAPRGRVRAGTPVVGRLTWFGQSCFLLETAAGTRVVMDPIAKGLGLRAARRAAGRSRHHQPRAPRPQQRRSRRRQAPGHPGTDRRQEGVDADRREGEGRRDPDGRRLPRRQARGRARPRHGVHLRGRRACASPTSATSGHALDDKQLAAIGSVDVVLVPVGGALTIDARQATQVVDQLRPRLLVVPMHYKVDGLTIEGSGVGGTVCRGEVQRAPGEGADDRALPGQGAARRRDRRPPLH